jgi:hypothetical protein
MNVGYINKSCQQPANQPTLQAALDRQLKNSALRIFDCAISVTRWENSSGPEPFRVPTPS